MMFLVYYYPVVMILYTASFMHTISNGGDGKTMAVFMVIHMFVTLSGAFLWEARKNLRTFKEMKRICELSDLYGIDPNNEDLKSINADLEDIDQNGGRLTINSLFSYISHKRIRESINNLKRLYLIP